MRIYLGPRWLRTVFRLVLRKDLLCRLCQICYSFSGGARRQAHPKSVASMAVRLSTSIVRFATHSITHNLDDRQHLQQPFMLRSGIVVSCLHSQTGQEERPSLLQHHAPPPVASSTHFSHRVVSPPCSTDCNIVDIIFAGLQQTLPSSKHRGGCCEHMLQRNITASPSTCNKTCRLVVPLTSSKQQYACCLVATCICCLAAVQLPICIISGTPLRSLRSSTAHRRLPPLKQISAGLQHLAPPLVALQH